MNWLDLLILLVLFISMSLSFFRGLVKEALSLGVWFFSIFVASLFHPSLSLIMQNVISSPALRAPLAFLLLFALTMLIGHFFAAIVRGMIQKAGLTPVDKSLGSVFGFLRGGMLIVLAVGLLRWANIFIDEPWWQASVLVPYAESCQDFADAIVQSIGIRLAGSPG